MTNQKSRGIRPSSTEDDIIESTLELMKQW